MADKRYTVKLDAYLWASTDKEAKKKAQAMAEFLRTFDYSENLSQILELHETPFASINPRKIDVF